MPDQSGIPPLTDSIKDMPEGVITFVNNGPLIKETNYWDMDLAKKGIVFFSINAGCIRMLVPDILHSDLPEMKTGKKIILSRGPMPKVNRDDAFEILFDDYSDEPYVIHVGIDQWDMVPKMEEGKKRMSKWQFAIWTRDGKFLEKKCYYRLVDRLPCLKAW